MSVLCWLGSHLWVSTRWERECVRCLRYEERTLRRGHSWHWEKRR